MSPALANWVGKIEAGVPGTMWSFSVPHRSILREVPEKQPSTLMYYARL
jgi:hypothetical protein